MKSFSDITLNNKKSVLLRNDQKACNAYIDKCRKHNKTSTNRRMLVHCT